MDGDSDRGGLVSASSIPQGEQLSREDGQAGSEVGARSDAGPKKGGRSLLSSPVRLATAWAKGSGQRLPGPSYPTSRNLAVRSPWPCPLPLGPPRRKPSSGASPWRSCCFINVSGGSGISSLSLCSLPPSHFLGPREVPLVLAEAEPRLRPLVSPWSQLLPSPPYPWELVLPARGHWDPCAQTRIPRITVNLSVYWVKCACPLRAGNPLSSLGFRGLADHPHFTDEETEARMGQTWPKPTKRQWQGWDHPPGLLALGSRRSY